MVSPATSKAARSPHRRRHDDWPGAVVNTHGHEGSGGTTQMLFVEITLPPLPFGIDAAGSLVKRWCRVPARHRPRWGIVGSDTPAARILPHAQRDLTGERVDQHDEHAHASDGNRARAVRVQHRAVNYGQERAPQTARCHGQQAFVADSQADNAGSIPVTRSVSKALGRSRSSWSLSLSAHRPVCLRRSVLETIVAARVRWQRQRDVARR